MPIDNYHATMGAADCQTSLNVRRNETRRGRAREGVVYRCNSGIMTIIIWEEVCPKNWATY